MGASSPSGKLDSRQPTVAPDPEAAVFRTGSPNFACFEFTAQRNPAFCESQSSTTTAASPCSDSRQPCGIPIAEATPGDEDNPSPVGRNTGAGGYTAAPQEGVPLRQHSRFDPVARK